jgi:DNA-binding transcriptional ArsR family regulator
MDELILNHMVQYQEELDGVFAALADPTRRAILQRLRAGSATISELADRFAMSLTGLKKHVRILEQAGLVRTEKVGRARRCSLGPRRLDDAGLWIETHGRMLEARMERFGELLQQTRDEPRAKTAKEPQKRGHKR